MASELSAAVRPLRVTNVNEESNQSAFLKSLAAPQKTKFRRRGKEDFISCA